MAAPTTSTVNITVNNDDTFTLAFDRSDAESMKLGRGVLLTLQRSSDEGHLAIAANMAKTPQPIITLTRSALELISQATENNSKPAVQTFHADVSDKLAESATCPECDQDVDSEGETLQEEAGCPMAGMGWTHPGDCSTCGFIDCDRSC